MGNVPNHPHIVAKQQIRELNDPINNLQVGEKMHIGNSAYKVTQFINTLYSGNVDKIVSCCDVRLTKLSHPELPHDRITMRLELLTRYTSSTTPFICDECKDYKVYYKKCS
ncbi:hypothetical protein E24_00092 [Faustovirus]|nr:hypothetical protein PRJ_Fausto_00083 [Faustovirus]AMN83025.1 hypothetical protein E24_00092 [Faustovirus]AMN84010.1 hypothetical protein D5a_00092 [Faustovirus]AMN84995.1 hypothetical protein E23_00092 [Faustovirus]QBR98997.1 hypothetical protein [Faustovirus mariensis]